MIYSNLLQFIGQGRLQKVTVISQPSSRKMMLAHDMVGVGAVYFRALLVKFNHGSPSVGAPAECIYAHVYR